MRIYRYPPPPVADFAGRLSARVPVHAGVDGAPRLAGVAGAPVRRDPRLQPARPLLPDRLRSSGPWASSFVYDQHDANPEILLAKRGRRAARRPAGARRTLGRALHLRARRRRHRPERFVQATGPDARAARAAETCSSCAARRAGRSSRWRGRRGFDRRGHRYLVGYLGVMGKQDGVDLLVRAVGELVREGYDILLYLAGDGECYAEIEDLVAGAGDGGQRAHAGLSDPRGVHARAASTPTCALPPIRQAPSTTSRR